MRAIDVAALVAAREHAGSRSEQFVHALRLFALARGNAKQAEIFADERRMVDGVKLVLRSATLPVTPTPTLPLSGGGSALPEWAHAILSAACDRRACQRLPVPHTWRGGCSQDRRAERR